MPSLNLPDPNKSPGDGAPADDINLVIEAINTLNSAVDNIPAGPQGPQGEPGTPGAPGVAATITVASTTTTEPGANAQVIQSGTAQNAQLAFYIPRGEQGPAGAAGAQGPIGPTGAQGPAGPGNTLSIGDVTTGAAGSPATASITGTPPSQTLNLTIPQGIKGDKGDTGATGPTGPQGPVGPPVNLSIQTPLPLGVADVGTSTAAARGDHVHEMPSASDVGADPVGSAASAQSAAEDYADSLAVNYDPAGSAASAQSAAEAYADGLAVNYDPAGSAASAQSAAEDYADSLAANYDPAGSASAVAGDLSSHESATTNVHGILDTANLATTQYVDEVAEGLIARPSVLGASTANINATYDNGASGVGATLTANTNGAFPSTFGGATGWDVYSGVLVKDQTDKAENGRYFISDMGSVSTPYVLTRCGYCDTSEEVPGSYIFVQDGTYAATGWVLVVDDPSTFIIGTDDINVYQFSGAGTYTAGYGLALDGTEFSLADSTALSVFGRSANTNGPLAAIVATNDHEVLRRSGTSIGFGTVATDGIADSAVTSAKIANGTIVNDDINASAGIAASKISGTAIVQSIVDAKGDLIVGTASDTVSRVGVGTDGFVLTADANETAGVKWAAASSDPTPTVMFLGGM